MLTRQGLFKVQSFAFGPVGGMGPGALTPFIVYRIIGGIGVGLASMLSPLYIAEIAPPNDRGRLVTLQQIAIVTGILVVYVVNRFIAAAVWMILMILPAMAARWTVQPHPHLEQ